MTTSPFAAPALRRILVTGGTGFLGRAFCEAAARAMPGVTLRVPTRRRAAGVSVQHLPQVELIQADIHDPAALTALLQGCDAVVHLVAILQGSAADFERAHVGLARTLVQACQAAGVKRVVHVSALGVQAGGPSHYLRSKAQGEAVLRESGLDLTVLRPSVIFGAQDRFLNTFAQLQALAPFVPLAGAQAQFQPVWVDDVAHAIVHALQHPQDTPPVLECAGPTVYTLRELVERAGRWSGHPRPVIPLPAWAAQLQAVAMELMPGEPLLSRDNLASMQVPNVATGTLPGLAALGISPTSLDAIGPTWLKPGQGCARLDALRARAGRR